VLVQPSSASSAGSRKKSVGYNDPQCKQLLTCVQVPPEFLTAQHTFGLAATLDSVAKRAVETYIHNTMDMWSWYQQVLERKSNGAQARETVQP